MLHRGIYGADPTRDQGPRQIFLDVIDECEVDLVLQGHDHVYMRTHQLKGINTESYIVDMDNDMVQGAGTVYSVVGSAALKRYDAKEVDYAAINVSLPTYDPSYTVIKFNDDGIEFIAKTNSGTLLDRFTINKN